MIFAVVFVLTQGINVGSDRDFDHFWSFGSLKLWTVNTPILFMFYLLQISPVTNQFEIIGFISCTMIRTKNKKGNPK